MSKMRNIVKKWQKLASVGKVHISADLQSPETVSSDCENEEFMPSAVATPEGYEVVYIGKSRRRYAINGRHLAHPLFRALWKRSEEFGVDQSLGISLGCEVVLFEHLLWLLDTSDVTIDPNGDESVHELAELYMPVRDSTAALSLLDDE